MEWNTEEWGEKTEYHIDDRTKLEGWSVGDEVQVMQDDDSASGLFAGTEVVVVGIAKRPGGMFHEGGDFLVVFEEGTEMPCAISPYIVGEVGEDLFDEDEEE